MNGRARIQTAGVALVMVLLVLAALAIIGTPFVISMALQEKSSLRFDGRVKARKAAEGARNHAVSRLNRTVFAVEAEAEAIEAGVLDGRDGQLLPRGRERRDRRRARGSGGVVIREDLGERREATEDRRMAGLLESRKGAAAKDYDPPEDLEGSLPERVIVPAKAPKTVALSSAGRTEASQGDIEVGFLEPRGVLATCEVSDEQGKVNINTAPPNLIANLFAVSVLVEDLEPADTEIHLQSASSFKSDGDPRTVDGAVMVVRPGALWGEAVTYTDRRSGRLRGLFRSAFFSAPAQRFPRGSFVYDLRGWKVAYHRLRAGAVNVFSMAELVEFSTIEAIREIANWQMASLFLTRLRGEGLTADFLQEHGVRERDLQQIGLDPALFEGDKARDNSLLRDELDGARRTLRRLQVSVDFIDRLLAARGARAVISFATRVELLSSKEAIEEARAVEEMLKRQRRKAPSFERDYLEKCLENLAEVYRRPGIETIQPEELERLRGSVTAVSSVAARWSEPQSVADEVLSTVLADDSEKTLQIARPGQHGAGTIVRIRNRKNPHVVEYNQSRGGGPNALILLFGVLNHYGPYEAMVDSLQRHPVNVNTASAVVLQAIFTGVAGRRMQRDDRDEYKREDEDKTPGVVMPAEARELARRIVAARPLEGPQAFREVLAEAAADGVIDPLDVEPLFINSIQPNHDWLLVSTTGFSYATGDVYTIESRGILRNEAGSEVVQTGFREIVEASPARALRWTLFTQSDFSSAIYLQNPHVPVLRLNYPENHSYSSASFPGTCSHLVRTTPLLTKQTFRYSSDPGTATRRAGSAVASFDWLPVAGGESGTLRLESPEVHCRTDTFSLFHFREGRNESRELPSGEALRLRGFGDQCRQSQVASRESRNVPAVVEAWMRFRTFPQTTTRDGLLILMDTGLEEERNRISVLYDRTSSEWIARIYDSSVRDPSIPEGMQYCEIRAQRPLDLQTWYHVRLAWDGTFSGGVQLYLDGLPVGQSNYSTKLSGDLPIQSAALPIQEWGDFPQNGVIRIDNELIAYENYQIRRRPPSYFQRWLVSQGQNQNNPALSGSLQGVLMRGASSLDLGNQRACVRSEHRRNSNVSLYGYSLRMKKQYRTYRDGRYSSHQATGAELVVGTGGRRLAEDLLPFEFPREVINIVNYNYFPGDLTGRGLPGAPSEAPSGGPTTARSPSAGQILAPVFRLNYDPVRDGLAATLPSGCEELEREVEELVDKVPPRFKQGLRIRAYSASFDSSGRRFDAGDFFQSRGVCRSGGMAVRYTKAPLAPAHPATTPGCWVTVQRRGNPFSPPQILTVPCSGYRAGDVLSGPVIVSCGNQATGLRVQSSYPQGPIPIEVFAHDARLELISLLADGPIASSYPHTGVLQIRGSPPPWQQAIRPDLRNSGLFAADPDDTVEWFRYYAIEGDMFIGDTGLHRDYPRGTNQLFHRGRRSLTGTTFGSTGDRQGEVISQVFELADGGAGFGDYVSISTNDPAVYEPQPRRVQKIVERPDGRFFVSVVAPSGQGLPFTRGYSANMAPRLVKFPTGEPPQVGTSNMVFFGDAIRTNLSSGVGAVTFEDIDEEIDSGFVLDEVRRTVAPELIDYYPVQGQSAEGSQHLRFALVPLVDGRVERIGAAPNGESLGGVIPRERNISRASPLEVFVVTVASPEWAEPPLFAYGRERGILRVNGELFYFENPNPQLVDGSRGRGRLVSLQEVEPPTSEELDPTGDFRILRRARRGQRDPLDRLKAHTLRAAGVTGHFEDEGFALIRFGRADLSGYREIFYYGGLTGTGFRDCLRGQFQTPLVADFDDEQRRSQQLPENPVHRVANVTVRLRLIGRGLLGTEQQTHGFSDPVSLVNSLDLTEVKGPLTDTGLAVASTETFPPSGYLLLDSTLPSQPYEIIAYKGIGGTNLFLRPRDESGRGILRGCFGTTPQPITPGMFAYALPFRHFDRYEPEIESEDLAYFQKSLRIRGALWRKISWKERKPEDGQERLCDIVVAVRFDGAPDWSANPTNRKGGLFLLDADEISWDDIPTFDLGVSADQIDLRVYFRYKNGSFQRVRRDYFRDDWKETPVLDALSVEYEKAGRILRHEETRF